MLNHRPVIAFTDSDQLLPTAWWATRCILYRLGALPVRMTPSTTDCPDVLHGIIIGGGIDISPHLYGEKSDKSVTAYDPKRDAFEMQLITQALSSNTPLLGICRGSQLINVTLGGTLYQDIRPQRQHTSNRNNILATKKITVAPDSLLYQITQTSAFKVNSLHKQAIKNVADPLAIAARDHDNFIQAISYPGRDFVLGVQWHPEYLPYSSYHWNIFKHFLSKAKQHAGYKPLFNLK